MMQAKASYHLCRACGSLARAINTRYAEAGYCLFRVCELSRDLGKLQHEPRQAACIGAGRRRSVQGNELGGTVPGNHQGVANGINQFNVWSGDICVFTFSRNYQTVFQMVITNLYSHQAVSEFLHIAVKLWGVFFFHLSHFGRRVIVLHFGINFAFPK